MTCCARTSAASIKVTGHEVTPGASPFACYTLLVTDEDGGEYQLKKRWNDLRLLEAALVAEGVGAKIAKCPKFDAHSWPWQSFTGTTLEASFLSERASQMNDVLQAWMEALGVTLKPVPDGPVAFQKFLSRETPGPGSTATPNKKAAKKDDTSIMSTEDETDSEAQPWRGAPPVVETGSESAKAAALADAAAKQAEEAEAEASPSSLCAALMWGSVLLLPLLAVVSKEALGVVDLADVATSLRALLPPSTA